MGGDVTLSKGRPVLVWRLAVGVAVVGFLASAGASLAQSPASSSEPTSNAVSLAAEPFLGGSFRPGTWAAFRVLVQNNGPVISGELRLTSAIAGPSKFGRQVELPPGARQEHVLYGRMGPFSGRFTIELVSGATTLAKQDYAAEAASVSALGVFVVAEQPQALIAPLASAVTGKGRGAPTVVSVTPEQLPPRAEAWGAADVVVWHDIASDRLDAERLEALRTWVATGGHLIIATGSTGTTTLGRFPPDMLPFQPSTTVELGPADLATVVGVPPADATPVTALTGPLERGVEIANIGGATVAARVDYGRGSVSVVGIDPATSWIASSAAAQALWSKVLPARPTPATNHPEAADDSVTSALSSMPAIQLPRLEHLILLIVAYIAAIGPLNYLVLRRRDRREWAWVTMPATIIVFAVGAYVFGVLLRGADVVVNELAIVRGAAGADRGLAQVYVGVYSPNRSTFDIRVTGDVLMSAPVGTTRRDMFEPSAASQEAVDVLLGDPATLRGYTIGFGALRAFRGETAVTTPRVDATLKLADNRLDGSLTNSSDMALEDVVVLYGHSAKIVGDLAAGQAADVSLPTTGSNSFGSDFSRTVLDQLFPETGATSTDEARQMAARRAMLRYLTGNQRDFGLDPSPTTSILSGDPVILAWVSAPTLDVDVGTSAEHLGERVYVLPVRAEVTGPVSFAGALVEHTTIDLDGVDAAEQGPFFVLGRGTATAEYRPVGFNGTFAASRASLVLTERQARNPNNNALDPLVPLPAEEQPDPDQPLATSPRPDDTSRAPRLQLFDRTANTWVEFEPIDYERSYDVPDPQRFVDASGALLARFVVRANAEPAVFTMAVRLEGDAT